MSDDCIFCSIANGEMNTELVVSNSNAVVFDDLSPQAPVHLLAIPRQHIENADEISLEDAAILSDLFAAGREAASIKGLTPKGSGNGYRLVFNVGEDAGNTVSHLHMHVMGGRKMQALPG